MFLEGAAFFVGPNLGDACPYPLDLILEWKVMGLSTTPFLTLEPELVDLAIFLIFAGEGGSKSDFSRGEVDVTVSEGKMDKSARSTVVESDMDKSVTAIVSLKELPQQQLIFLSTLINWIKEVKPLEPKSKSLKDKISEI